MSEPQPIAIGSNGGTDVRSVIARAARKTGVDFNYLLAQAKLESGLDPSARAATSSAAGLYQFTNDTWLRTLDRHGADHGLDWARAGIGAGTGAGQALDPQTRAQIMALRFDPDASALMAGELARDNRAELIGVLGREPDSSELYLAHFLGTGGASRFLTALAADPGQSAASLLPKAAAANRPIFYEASGAPRTVGGVMDLIRTKLASAMEGEGAGWAVRDISPSQTPDAGGNRFAGGPVAQEFLAARQEAAGAGRQSMAETLRGAFSVASATGDGSTPEFVRAAYGQLRRFGL